MDFRFGNSSHAEQAYRYSIVGSVNRYQDFDSHFRLKRDRPRERLARAGEGALSTAELLAIILRTGGRGESALAMASRLLARFKGLAGLARASFFELVADACT